MIAAARSKLPATGVIEKLVAGVKNVTIGGPEEAGSFNYAVAVNRWSMRLLGLWPLDAPRLSHLRWATSIAVALLVMSPAIAGVFVITDLVAIMNQVNLTLPSVPTFMRFVVMKAKAQNLRAILHSIRLDWANYRYMSAQNRRIMLHYANRGRRINVVFIAWMILTIAVYIMTPFGNAWMSNNSENTTGRKLPTEVFFPFLLEQSYAYEMIYIGQSVTMAIGGMVVFSVDCFLCVIVFHACGQLDVLAATLERYDGTVEHDRTNDARSRSCACLPCIVKRHVHIVNYMDVVEKSFNSFVLSQLLVTTVILALQDFQIVLFARENNVSGFVAYVMYGITFTFYVFIYCYVGDCIIEKSENIGRTAYNLEWINFPRNYARPIILLIARSRRPCKITAWKFATMSLSYYKTIIMTSLSYLSVLLAFK